MVYWVYQEPKSCQWRNDGILSGSWTGLLVISSVFYIISRLLLLNLSNFLHIIIFSNFFRRNLLNDHMIYNIKLYKCEIYKLDKIFYLKYKLY